MPAGEDDEDRMEEDEEEDAEMAYEDEEDEEEADVPSGEPMSVGSTEVHDMLLGSEASPARSAPAEPPRRCALPPHGWPRTCQARLGALPCAGSCTAQQRGPLRCAMCCRTSRPC